LAYRGDNSNRKHPRQKRSSRWALFDITTFSVAIIPPPLSENISVVVVVVIVVVVVVKHWDWVYDRNDGCSRLSLDEISSYLSSSWESNP